jgi:hypothetical protein
MCRQEGTYICAIKLAPDLYLELHYLHPTPLSPSHVLVCFDRMHPPYLMQCWYLIFFLIYFFFREEDEECGVLSVVFLGAGHGVGHHCAQSPGGRITGGGAHALQLPPHSAHPPPPLHWSASIFLSPSIPHLNIFCSPVRVLEKRRKAKPELSKYLHPTNSHLRLLGTAIRCLCIKLMPLDCVEGLAKPLICVKGLSAVWGNEERGARRFFVCPPLLRLSTQNSNRHHRR